jgi:hypothetical protein
MKKRQSLLFFGVLLTTGFGGQFLIRIVRDGDFYIADFIGGIIGLILLIGSIFAKKSNET